MKDLKVKLTSAIIASMLLFVACNNTNNTNNNEDTTGLTDPSRTTVDTTISAVTQFKVIVITTTKKTATTTKKATTTTKKATTTTKKATTTTKKATTTTKATTKSASNSTATLTAEQQEILRLVNAERAKMGKAALSGSNANLNKAAMKRAEEISRTFSHTRPNGSKWSTVLAEYSVTNWSAIGENIAAGQKTPADVVKAWMNSEGHRANILGSYTTIGIGCYKINNTWYWSQNFAKF